jgi:hypothetical protein
MLLLLLHGTKSDFLDFLEKQSCTDGHNFKLAKSSETTVQKNSLRGCNPQVVSVPQLLRETSDIQPHKTFQEDCTNEGTSPDPDAVSYARPLKVTKAKRF